MERLFSLMPCADLGFCFVAIYGSNRVKVNIFITLIHPVFYQTDFNLMRIPLAYISVIFLWATTPLAIKWSGEGPGFLFGVTARITIGAVCILFVMMLMRQCLVWHRKARQTYLAVALQIYGSMLAVYWAAQFIPSGWISVI